VLSLSRCGEGRPCRRSGAAAVRCGPAVMRRQARHLLCGCIHVPSRGRADLMAQTRREGEEMRVRGLEASRATKGARSASRGAALAPRVRRRAAAETRGVPACMQHSKVQHAGRQPHAPSRRDADPLAKPGKGSAHAADGRRARNAGAGRGKGEAACLWCSGAWRRDVRGRASGWRRPVAPTPRLPAAPLIRRAPRPVDPSFSPPTLTHRIALERLQHTLLPSPPPHPPTTTCPAAEREARVSAKAAPSVTAR
jgi:hypothetical protein